MYSSGTSQERAAMSRTWLYRLAVTSLGLAIGYSASALPNRSAVASTEADPTELLCVTCECYTQCSWVYTSYIHVVTCRRCQNSELGMICTPERRRVRVEKLICKDNGCSCGNWEIDSRSRCRT